ncbi:MAG: 3'(2'),5'-bisphosphate nucleotidase [Phycisphaeraceae bacterium]
MSIDCQRELQVGLDAVSRAMAVCQRVRSHLITSDTLTKKDRSPVTVADFASQAIVCAALAEALPDDLIVGEEASGTLRQPEQATISEAVVNHVRSALPQADEATTLGWIDRGAADGSTDRYWTLDPIDGTKGFLRGEQYAVALALLINKRVVLGILGCPNLVTAHGTGAILYAVRGQGTWLIENTATKSSPVQVTSRGDVAPSNVRFCESVESGHSDQDTSQQIAALLGITAPPLRMDSQVKYGAVALAKAHIYLRLPTRSDYREMVWDHAAGSIVLEEAGGTVSDASGLPLDFAHGRQLEANRGIVATHGVNHDRVIQAIRAAGVNAS